jgi:hypothetical protein
MSIFIAFNMLIITLKTNYDMCQGDVFLIAISSTRSCEQVGRQSKHFMFVCSPQYGSIFLACIWMQFKL